MPLFDRSVQLDIIDTDGLGLSFKELRVKFQVDKTDRFYPNKAQIQIYNLARTSAALVEEKNHIVRLYAGYDGKTQLIFEGDIDPKASRTEQTGADRITIIESGTSYIKLVNERVEKAYKQGTAYNTIIKDLVKVLGVAVKDISSLPNDKIFNGIALSGYVRDHINDIARKFDLNWSIQDGEIQFLRKNGGANNEPIILVDSSKGLIGTPRKKATGIEFTSLLNAQIYPGRRVQLISENLKGVFVPNRVWHVGDSQVNDDFYTIVEAADAV